MADPPVVRGHGGRRDFRRIAEQHPDGIAVVDSVGVVVYANPAAARLLARRLVDLVGKRLGVSVGRVQPIKLEVPGPDGRKGEVELTWTACAWRDEPATLFTIRDVSHVRRAAAALKRSQVRFRTLMEHLPDGVVLHRRGRIFYVNPTLATMLGYESELGEFGRFLVDHVAPDDHRRARKAFGIDEGAVPIGGPVELQLLDHEGGEVAVECRSIVVQHDSVESTLTIVQDVRQRKSVVAKMMQLDRLASMGTLAAGIGHEINNPMTFVHGNLELAMEQLDELQPGVRLSAEVLDDLRVAVDAALNGATRVTEIVGDFRTFTRQEQRAHRPVDLIETLRFAVKMAAHHTRHRARVEEDFVPVRKVSGDPTRLGQVFLNLLVNAADACGDGPLEDNVIVLRTRDDGDHVIVEVADNGVGIPPEAHRRIFEPFYTTKGPGEGTGLGLAIAMETVMGHGGQMTVASDIGQGTTFRVRLPVAAIATMPGTLAPEGATEPPPALVGRGGRVLVIDDEPRVGDVVRSALAPRYEVVSTDEPIAGLEMLLRADSGFDLILCDLLMPSLSGMQLFETVERTRPDIADRIVFITAGGSTPASQAFEKEQASRLLRKPLGISDLRRFVAHHIERHRASD